MPSEPPAPPSRNDPERDVRRLERLLPEVIKRIIEAGYEKLAEGPENVRQRMADLKLPKEVLALMLSQVDETKNGVYRVVAKEIRDFLEHTNFSEELVKVLTTLSFEVKTEVRFVPNEARSLAFPEVRSKVRVHRQGREDRRSTMPPPPAQQNAGHQNAGHQSAGHQSAGHQSAGHQSTAPVAGTRREDHDSDV